MARKCIGTRSQVNCFPFRNPGLSRTLLRPPLLTVSRGRVSLSAEAGMKKATSIGEYLIQRLCAHGVRHVFGIPGDYVLGFYEQLLRSPLRIINTCDEQGAGFAADGYARVRGLGAVCVTYCVGGLKVATITTVAFEVKTEVGVVCW